MLLLTLPFCRLPPSIPHPSESRRLEQTYTQQDIRLELMAILQLAPTCTRLGLMDILQLVQTCIRLELMVTLQLALMCIRLGIRPTTQLVPMVTRRVQKSTQLSIQPGLMVKLRPARPVLMDTRLVPKRIQLIIPAGMFTLPVLRPIRLALPVVKSTQLVATLIQLVAKPAVTFTRLALPAAVIIHLAGIPIRLLFTRPAPPVVTFTQLALKLPAVTSTLPVQELPAETFIPLALKLPAVTFSLLALVLPAVTSTLPVQELPAEMCTLRARVPQAVMFTPLPQSLLARLRPRLDRPRQVRLGPTLALVL